ncbi:MAG: hypothetical protein ACI8YQ_000040 [Polaribacter sp.]|jgi:hypothetical protein
MAHVTYGQFYTLDAHRSNGDLHLDGRLLEADWGEAQTISSFWMNYPFDTLVAQSETEVQVLISGSHLYIGAICYHASSKHRYVVQSLKRDFSFRENESFSVIIDAFNDANSGFNFTVNPFGSQSDGLIANGGTRGTIQSWDGLWRAEVFRTEGYWSVEMAIPLKTLRYSEKSDTWSINFARNDLHRNEVSTWVPVQRGRKVVTLVSMGKLLLGDKLESRTNAVIIPYLAGIIGKEYPGKTEAKPRVGADAKIALSSSLYLDLTANPDFSQVEVDRQVIDLSRFELFFPERRLFFLENSDLFSTLGNRRIYPLFSRRIGGADNIPVPIRFGARVSGKLNKDWRLGLMTIQTALTDSLLDSKGNNNYSVATLQRTVLSGSTVTAFIANRQRFSDLDPSNDFNRVAGLEFDYRSKDSRWAGKTFVHRSFNPKRTDDALSYSAKMRYRLKKFSIRAAVDAVGENYITDMGYVPRLYNENEVTDKPVRIGYHQWRLNLRYRFFFEKNKVIDFISPNLNFELFTGEAWEVHETQVNANVFVRFMDASQFRIAYKNQSQVLFFPFSLSGLDQPFPAGKYPFRYFETEYDSGKRKALSYALRAGMGQQYRGKRIQLDGELSYRIKQYANFGITYSHKNLYNFSEEYGAACFNLIGSKAEISFNRNLFFTTYLQYNTQTNNININSRFQWRFRPLSDLYLVYTENYLAENVEVKNRALVLKLNYWWGF